MISMMLSHPPHLTLLLTLLLLHSILPTRMPTNLSPNLQPQPSIQPSSAPSQQPYPPTHQLTQHAPHHAGSMGSYVANGGLEIGGRSGGVGVGGSQGQFGKRKNQGFNMDRTSVLGIQELPYNNRLIWSAQTIQNLATANLLDKLIADIASRSYSTTSTTTTTTYTETTTSNTTTTQQHTITSNTSNTTSNTTSNISATNESTLVPAVQTPPIQNQNKNKTFQLNFNVLQSADLRVNQSFAFQRKKKLPDVPPIKLTYDQYLADFKPALFRAPPEQKLFRQSVYGTNLQLINVNNAQVRRDINMGLNLFTDVELNEFYKKYNKLVVPDSLIKEGLLEEARLKDQNGKIVFTKPPRIIIDWSCLASDVISQGACGASYIIAPLESITMTMRMYNQSAQFLSIQQVLSCGSEQNGCTNGFFTGTYNYVQKFGVGQSSFYFYDNKAKFNSEVSQCNRTVIGNRLYTKNKIFIQSNKRIKYGDCEQVVKQLRFKILSVAIAGNGLQFYSEGTFNTISTDINHGVTLVGYQPDQGYLIKNSWGRTWGILGYGYVSESTGVCSFAMHPVTKIQLGAPRMCSPQV